MPDPEAQDRLLARRARKASITIAATMLIWLAATYLGGQLGWPPVLALVFDLMAGIGLIVGMVITWRVYQERRANR